MQLIAWILAVPFAALLIRYVRKRSTNNIDVAKELREFAEENRVSPDASFVWKHRGIAINKARSVLLYIDAKGKTPVRHLISLTQLKNCNIVRTYKSAKIDKATGKPPVSYLSSISLRLLLEDDQKSNVVLPFYSSGHDKVTDMKMLFQKAWHWKRIITP